jgi:putative hydroxymethylpyrimidine transport system substrate-binding protein
MKISSWLLGLAAGVALLAGCGGSGESAEHVEARPATVKLRLTLDAPIGPENVGIPMAAELGYFDDVGLDVWVGSPIEPNRPVSYIAKGTDDIGVAQQPQVVIAKEKGMPIVAIGSVIAQPTAAMIWLTSSKIHGISDLAGKTIAVPGIPYQERFLQSLLARAEVKRGDVELKRVPYNLVPTLLSGRADAIFGGSWNLEGRELKSRGAEPVITRVQDLGIPDYEELVVIAPTSMVADDPQTVRDFMSAVARGTAAAVDHPDAAVQLIAKSSGGIADRRVLEAQIRATLPLFSRSGYMDPDRAQGLMDWMGEEGLIARSLPTSLLLTNDFR